MSSGAMAGKHIWCNPRCHQEMVLASTSNCCARRLFWRNETLYPTSVSNSCGRGLHQDSVLTASLPWTNAFLSCRVRNSRAKAMPRKRSLVIVCESMDEPSESDLKKKYELRSFLKGLSPQEQVADSPFVEKDFWTWNPMTLLDKVADYADRQTEIGMYSRRAFYKAEDWTQHRSSKRHLRHVLSTFSSRVIISLIPPVTALTSMAAIIATYNSLVDLHVLPYIFPLLHTSSVPYQLTAPALALLLVFRTEASYSRYDEGRKTWTKVFACTKNFSRQCLSWIQDPHDFNRRIDLQHYIMAFPVALKCHLLDGSNIYEDLKLLLDEEDLALVMRSQHRPNCLIQLMTQSLGLVEITENQRSLMDANISQFNESISVCERIVRSPIPLSYTRLTSRALTLWHMTLPIVLWDDCKWMVVFATFFSSCTLFCIENVGVLIEEPFPMLSLDKMCAIAHQNVQELVELQGVTDEYLKAKEMKLRTSAASGTGPFGRVPSNGLSKNC